MRLSRGRVIVVERTVRASAQPIFDILADPRAHRSIDGSATVGEASLDAPARLFPGARFTVRMRTWPSDLNGPSLVQVAVALANRGRLTNTVLEFEEPRRIAWRNFGRHVWRYELDPVPGDPEHTRVRETFDYRASLNPRLLELAGFPNTNREAMRRTLELLAEAATADR